MVVRVRRLAPCLVLMLVVWAGLSVVPPVAAQETTPEFSLINPDHPLLRLLRLVPSIPSAREGVPALAYVDYRALEQARPDVPAYETWAEWHAANEARDPESLLWNINRQRVRVPQEAAIGRSMFSSEGETPDLLGFDVFDIDQSISFGQPPTQGLILAGDFDAGAIQAAYEARDYDAEVVAQADGGALLLSAGDRDAGLAFDPANRNFANIFGGDLGRREPLGVVQTDVADYLLSSADLDVVNAMLDTSAGEERSFASIPSYRAAAESLINFDGGLVQALFFRTEDVAFLSNLPLIIFDMPADPTEMAQRVEELETGDPAYGPLPPYFLAVLADRQEAGMPVATVALVYNDRESAELAAAEMAHRLSIFADFNRRREIPLIEEVGATVSDPDVYAASNGMFVALASVVSPIVGNEHYNLLTGEPVAEGEEGGNPRPSHIMFSFWVSNIYSRSFYPLTIKAE